MVEKNWQSKSKDKPTQIVSKESIRPLKDFTAPQNELMPVRSADGLTLIWDRKEDFDRWAEHFNQLLNNQTDSDVTLPNDLQELPTQEEMDQPLTLQEVIKALEGPKPWNAPGPDVLPAELLIGVALASRE